MDEIQFIESLKEQGIQINEEQLKQFNEYYKLLIEWNEKMNLTAITEKKEVFLKHFYDSISASFYFDMDRPLNIVDVGAGAGFPSIPLKICFPKLKVTIVDSLNKRITFLNTLADNLSLKDVSFYHSRAEDFARDKEHREQYDLAIARAVARLPVLTELCLPLVKNKGSFIAMKGASAKEELAEASKAISLLGGQLIESHSFQLPNDEGERSIIIIDKKKVSPKKYPRKAGVPNKQPLI